jgi:hypothetical protein
VPNIVEYDRRATRKAKLYGADTDDCTVLRVFDAYGIEGSNRIQPELRSERSYVVRSTRIEEEASGILRRTRTFALVVLSTLRMFGSSSGVTLAILRKVVEDEPQKFTSSERLPLCVDFPFYAFRARHSVLTCSGFLQ